MHRSTLAACTLLMVGIFVTGCGSESVEVGSESRPTAIPSPPPGETQSEFFQRADRAYAEWLRSDEAKNLDLKSIAKYEDQGTRLDGPPTFDEAIDEADMVVSGTVKDLVFIPYATMSTFQVDRTAKGESKTTIILAQGSHVRNEGGVPKLVYDPLASLLTKGDRAVLVLKEYTVADLSPEQQQFVGDRYDGVPIYTILRGSGQYRSEGGKVRIEPDISKFDKREKRYDGKTERELMDAAESRAKKKRADS